MLREAKLTMVEGLIHNPDEPGHFMKVKPVAGRVRVRAHGVVLAETRAAVRVLEVGRDMYDPVLYLPSEAMKVGFAASDRRTIFPLKGEALHLHLTGADGEVIAADIAWHYPRPYSFAEAIRGRIGFYGDKAVIEEHPE